MQQLKQPTVLPALGELKYFAVNHLRMQTKREVVRFCKWIRTVISASPIDHLRIICDDGHDGSYGANISFDNIIDHLVRKRSRMLRVLDFRYAYLGVNAVQCLFKTCAFLEEFHISAGKPAIVSSLSGFRLGKNESRTYAYRILFENTYRI